MHMLRREALAFAGALREAVEGLEGRTVVIAPPFTLLGPLAESFRGSGVLLAAQNVHDQPQGAFTGEISAAMLADVGCTHVLVGHSERRTLFGETHPFLNRKVRAALREGLRPILCVGETLAQREAGETLAVVFRQITEGLQEISRDDMRRLVIAYEPVWAIGTGRTATADQAQEVHARIRAHLEALSGAETADTVPVLYGGSVTPDNVDGLMACRDIDGVLVGGASLKIETFRRIVRFGGKAGQQRG